MRKEASNNRAILRPTPAVQKTKHEETRNLNAMKITDNKSCAALVCSTERIRSHSKSSRNATRIQYVAVQKRVTFCCGCFLATNTLTTQSYLLHITATKTKFCYIIYIQAGFMSFHPIFSVHFSQTIRLQKCIQKIQ